MGDKSIPKLRFPEFTDEWEQRKLSEVAEIIGGGTPSTNNPEYWDGDIDWYSPAEINDQIYVDSSEKKITKLGLEKSSAKILPANKTVLFTSRAGIGKTAILRRSGTTNQGFQSMVLDDETNPYFIFSMSNFIKEKADRVASGSTFAEISGKMLGNLDFMFPTKQEQDKIGEYFSNLDHLITLHQRKCYCLKKLRDGIIQKILSRELRFKRADGREFENWVTKELWEILTERKVSQTITEDAPLLSFTIEQGVIKPQDKKTNKRDFLIKDKETKKFALTEVDDIIYNPANLKYGAIHRNKLMRGVVSPIYAIFYTEQNPAFMEYVVKNPIFIKNSMKYLEGTVIKLMTLKPRDFLKLKVEIPASLEEQKIIADFLMKFDETIDAEQKRIETWKELKKGLLQQMFV